MAKVSCSSLEIEPRVISVRLLQPLKAESLISSTCSKERASKLLQPRKALDPTEVTLGIEITSSDIQFLKHEFGIIVSSGKAMLLKLAFPSKALFPNFVTFSKCITSSRLVQLENAPSPISVTSSVKVTLFKL